MQSILNLPLLNHNLQRLLTGLLGMNKLIKLIKINQRLGYFIDKSMESFSIQFFSYKTKVWVLNQN